MDDLEFRRRIYAAPNTTESDLIQAAQNDETKLRFWQQIKNQDQLCQEALNVDVPDDLAHKLIWQQVSFENQRQKRRTKWYIAMAASFAFVFGISATLWFQQTHVDLSRAALAHTHYAETEQSVTNQPLDLNFVNAKLATFGARLQNSPDIGEILVANYCHLESVRSLHLILATAEGRVSVFFTPLTEKQNLAADFADETYHGNGVKLQRANVIVVGEKGADLAPLTQKIKRNLLFSA